MRVCLFYHSLVSDWNHGNAHFLRGVASELISRGHDVAVFEPRDAWSLQNLLADHGERALEGFQAAYPTLRGERYDLATLDLDRALDGADLVLVHEWSDPELVARVGGRRAAGPVNEPRTSAVPAGTASRTLTPEGGIVAVVARGHRVAEDVAGLDVAAVEVPHGLGHGQLRLAEVGGERHRLDAVHVEGRRRRERGARRPVAERARSSGGMYPRPRAWRPPRARGRSPWARVPERAW